MFQVPVLVSGDAGSETLREAEFFKKCMELGIILKSEADRIGIPQDCLGITP
jgi:hypothetical protein